MEIASVLTKLEVNGLIQLHQHEPELEYLFRHALVQDAAYDSLLKADKRRMHLLIGEIIEALYPERLEELSPLLARHFQEAGENTRAADYYARAGQRAMNTYANHEALDYFRSAIHLSDDKASDALANLYMRLGAVCFTLGNQIEAVEAYRAAARIYREIGNIARSAISYNQISRSYFYAGDFQSQYQLALEGYELIKNEPETVEMVVLVRNLATACYFNGMVNEAIQYAEQALHMAHQLGSKEEICASLVTYGTTMPYNESKKKLETMQAAVQAAVDLRRELGRQPAVIEPATYNYAEALFLVNGEWQRACEIFQESVARAKSLNAVLAEFWHTSGWQKVLTAAGQLAQAAALDERIEELTAAIRDHGTVEGTLVVTQAIRAYYTGQAAEAIALLENGLSAAIKNNDQQLINEMGTWLAEISLDAGRYDIAAEILPKAISAGDRNLIWGGAIPRCLLAAVYIHNGQVESARQTILEAEHLAQPDPGRMAQYALALARARLASAEKRLPEAAAFYEQACVLSEQMGLSWQHRRATTEWKGVKLHL